MALAPPLRHAVAGRSVAARGLLEGRASRAAQRMAGRAEGGRPVGKEESPGGDLGRRRTAAAARELRRTFTRRRRALHSFGTRERARVLASGPAPSFFFRRGRCQ